MFRSMPIIWTGKLVFDELNGLLIPSGMQVDGVNVRKLEQVFRCGVNLSRGIFESIKESIDSPLENHVYIYQGGYEIYTLHKYELH